MRYLIITYVRKPDGKIDEQVQVAKKVKDSDIQMANVIMDFKEKKLMKCLVESQVIQSDFDKMLAYYIQVYPAIIERLTNEANEE
jgi:hypothetical protein